MGIELRDSCLQEVASRLAAEGALALLLIDVSALAEVERTHGTEAYDRALAGVTDLIEEQLRRRFASDDIAVARVVGGDEVAAFLMRPRADDHFYQEELSQIHQDLARVLERDGSRAAYPYVRTRIGFPVGAAFILYNSARRIERQLQQLVAEAREDVRLQAGLRARERAWQLRRLLVGERIRTHFQPIVDLREGEVFGYEALARGPEGSDLRTPASLFRAAREANLVFELDCVCRRRALEHSTLLPTGKLLFLNCLPTAIRDPGFRGKPLQRTLGKLRLAPTQIVLEISEQESIDNFTIFREMRDAYREIGMKIAVDDAGVGYASLEAIMEVAPDFVKADRALVTGIESDPPRQEVLRALQAVADRIGALVIAEGVETPQELRTLRELGIPYGQGFLLGEPMDLERPA